jgi:hypothetical protein
MLHIGIFLLWLCLKICSFDGTLLVCVCVCVCAHARAHAHSWVCLFSFFLPYMCMLGYYLEVVTKLSFQMLILLLNACTVWKWAVLPVFQKNILPPSSGLFMGEVCFSETSATQPTSTQCKYPNLGWTVNTVNRHESLNQLWPFSLILSWIVTVRLNCAVNKELLKWTNCVLRLHFFYYIDCNNTELSQWPPGLRHRPWSRGCWDHGFESHLRHGVCPRLFTSLFASSPYHRHYVV